MDNFRKTIRIRKIILVIISILLAFINAYMAFFSNFNVSGTAGHINGYQFGLATAANVLAVVFAIKYARAENNQNKLKELYIQETDERKLLIFQKSGSTGMNIVMWGFLIASVFAGYINFYVYLTLIFALFFVAIVRLILKFYFSSKY